MFGSRCAWQSWTICESNRTHPLKGLQQGAKARYHANRGSPRKQTKRNNRYWWWWWSSCKCKIYYIIYIINIRIINPWGSKANGSQLLCIICTSDSAINLQSTLIQCKLHKWSRQVPLCNHIFSSPQDWLLSLAFTANLSHQFQKCLCLSNCWKLKQINCLEGPNISKHQASQIWQGKVTYFLLLRNKIKYQTTNVAHCTKCPKQSQTESLCYQSSSQHLTT